MLYIPYRIALEILSQNQPYKYKMQKFTLISDPVTQLRRPTNYAAITFDALDI